MVATLRIRRLTATAQAPARAEPGSVGYDLCLDLGGEGAVTLLQGQRLLAPTGIAAAPPEGCYIRVAPRSGLSAKHGFNVGAGVIDPSYRGEIKVSLTHGGQGRLIVQRRGDAVVCEEEADEPVTLQHGDRIAQLVIERCETPEVEEVDSLDETERGAGGFGSTGLNKRPSLA